MAIDPATLKPGTLFFFVGRNCAYELVQPDPFKFCTLGGGFVCSLKPDSTTVIECAGDDAQRRLDDAPWRLAEFGSEWYGDENRVQGWLKGHAINGDARWNGWAIPVFTREQVEVVMERQNTKDSTLTYEWDGLDLVCHSTMWDEEGEEPMRMHATLLELPGLGEVHVWQIDCPGGMTWDEDVPQDHEIE